MDTTRLVDDNFDDPSLTNFDLLEQNILDLRSGRPTEAPVFDFATRERAGFQPVSMGDTRVLLVEGLYALNARVRPLLDLSVAINGGVHFDLIKRIQRDVGAGGAAAVAGPGAGACVAGQRGAAGGDTPESIIKQICDTVFPMFKARAAVRIQFDSICPIEQGQSATQTPLLFSHSQFSVRGPNACVSVLTRLSAYPSAYPQAFIESDLESAAIRIRNTFNPFAGFLTNATYTLKSTRADVPTERVEALFELHGNGPCEAEREHTVDLYLMPPGEDQETCRDWIRMRLRDGRYSLLFEEYISDGPLLISPSVSYEVHVRVLSGLMSLGYSIGAIIKRSSIVYKGHLFTCKFDEIVQLDKKYFQV